MNDQLLIICRQIKGKMKLAPNIFKAEKANNSYSPMNLSVSYNRR